MGGRPQHPLQRMNTVNTELIIQWGEGERRVNKESIIGSATGAIIDTPLFPFIKGEHILE